MTRHDTVRALRLSLFVLASSGCASTGRLGEYDFRDRALAVVMVSPPRPDVFTGSVPEATSTWQEALLKAGSQIVRGAEAAKLQERMDEVADEVDVASILADKALERASQILRMRPVEAARDADFELEIRLERYGITANDWDAQANFFVKAEVLLLDAADGSLVWKTKVEESEPVNEGTEGLSSAAVNVVTAATFATLSNEDIERAFTGLAQFCADRATRKLQQGMDKVRGG
jgi:hypothetical protein